MSTCNFFNKNTTSYFKSARDSSNTKLGIPKLKANHWQEKYSCSTLLQNSIKFENFRRLFTSPMFGISVVRIVYRCPNANASNWVGNSPMKYLKNKELIVSHGK